MSPDQLLFHVCSLFKNFTFVLISLLHSAVEYLRMCGGREMSELGAWSRTGFLPAPIKPWYSSRARTNQGILEMRVKKQGDKSQQEIHRQGKYKGCACAITILVSAILPRTARYRQVSVLRSQYRVQILPLVYFHLT